MDGGTVLLVVVLLFVLLVVVSVVKAVQIIPQAQARQAVLPIGVPDQHVPASPWPAPQQLPSSVAPAVEPPRPRPVAAPTTPLANGEPESAQPTPPRGMPRSPAESGNGHGGNGSGEDEHPEPDPASDGPPRPGYPSPPPRT